MKRDDFFVGWAGRLPRAHRGVVALAVACLLGGSALLPLALARGTADPGSGAFEWGAGEQTLTGTLTILPYPTVWTPPDAAHPRGHTVLLSGEGKERPDVAAGDDGKLVAAKGFLIRRGETETLQAGSVQRVDGLPGAPPVTPLGTWRIAGEICDGKCAIGAMRPGRGAAHRPCANLCLIGGLPPVLLSTGAIDGHDTLLLADRGGAALSERLHDDVAVPIVLEGAVELRGDLLILRTTLP
ncbi:MAG TPA: hypothetical protein VHS58_19520 [Acetobacteraceae bacterium]|nr:hypothetical protein [Acetobacteraceae bacterium]